MSRARPIRLPDGTVKWFDVLRNSEKASGEQIELLAMIEEIDLDDLLDQNLTQGEVIRRLREILHGDAIPAPVLERRERWRKARSVQPQCRICKKEGDSTKHHFVNKWMLRELDGYERLWSDRSKNCIPLCLDCHRDLHFRGNGPQPCIADYLSEKEREFAERALQAFADQHPRILILVGKGTRNVYEAALIQDWMAGKFQPAYQAEDQEVNGLRVAA